LCSLNSLLVLSSQDYVKLLVRMQKKIHGFARYSGRALEKHMDWGERVGWRLFHSLFP